MELEIDIEKLFCVDRESKFILTNKEKSISVELPNQLVVLGGTSKLFYVYDGGNLASYRFLDNTKIQVIKMLMPKTSQNVYKYFGHAVHNNKLYIGGGGICLKTYHKLGKSHKFS